MNYSMSKKTNAIVLSEYPIQFYLVSITYSSA